MIFGLFVLHLSFIALANEGQSNSTEVITIYGDLQSALRVRQDADSAEINERASAEEVKRFGAQSLADAVKSLQGIDTQTFCSNCGAKRVSINGLRGEHTTVLVDGIPVHSSVSSFYGLDSVPISGIEEIQVKRGAGNALSSPEAIGGTINLITKKPLENGLLLSTLNGSVGTANHELIANSAGKSHSTLVSLQHAELQPWDIDNNGVAESPRRKTKNIFLNANFDINAKNNFNMRYSGAWLDILGGTTSGFVPTEYPKKVATGSDFVNGDVRQKFIGSNENLITENVKLARRELAIQTTTLLSGTDQLELRAAKVDQQQNAIYAHGYDYNSDDEIYFGNIRYVNLIDDHLLSMGIENKFQKMKSQSQALYVDRATPLTPDNFQYTNQALYFMDEWEVSEQISTAFAARWDRFDVQWTELGNGIRESLLSPRFKIKYNHTHHLISRFSYGMGYRPPLTIFESQHGNDHDGFVIEIDKIEKAQSAVYSLSTNHPKWFITGAAHATRLQHMAYGEDRVSQGLPVRFINSEETFDLLTTDLVFGGIPLTGWDIQVAYERFHLPKTYTLRLPTAAIEQRVKIDSFWKKGDFQLGLRMSWVGSRDLTRYGYDDHFNKFDDDITSPSFGQTMDQKWQKVPAYWTADFNLAFQFAKNYNFRLIINNVFDFTQTGAGDSPTTWHRHAADDIHFDNFHTWGPLRGREFLAGLQAQF